MESVQVSVMWRMIHPLIKYGESSKRKKALLEECITQHHELSEFNPTSVNTLRIVTVLCPDNNVKIMTADLRLGRKGKVADNFHHNGIASLIDVDTGIIYTMGIDKNRRRYIVHPDSKKQIIGFVFHSGSRLKKRFVKRH